MLSRRGRVVLRMNDPGFCWSGRVNPRIVVLGGSSPFTAALVDALVDVAHQLPTCELVLHGRQVDHLRLIAQYVQHHLGPFGWSAEVSTKLAEAVADADIVLHQIRYGDMAGRAEDERIALQFQLPPDETLGPSALYSILRIVPALDQMSQELADACPQAWILNLTNPLSLVTARMIDRGLLRCVGLCELPQVTAIEAAKVLALRFDDLTFAYAGFNHRGFIVELNGEGKNWIGTLIQQLGEATIGGVGAADMAPLAALPTKYFRLIAGPTSPQSGRAAFLTTLRHQIQRELRQDITTSPPSLQQRYLEWYPQSVVPMIRALLAPEPTLQMVNTRSPDGVVEEHHAWVSAGGIKAVPMPAVSDGVAKWLRLYRGHELAQLQMMRHPCPETVEAALQADPLVPSAQVKSIAQVIWKRYEAGSF